MSVYVCLFWSEYLDQPQQGWADGWAGVGTLVCLCICLLGSGRPVPTGGSEHSDCAPPSRHPLASVLKLVVSAPPQALLRVVLLACREGLSLLHLGLNSLGPMPTSCEMPLAPEHVVKAGILTIQKQHENWRLSCSRLR